MNNYLLLVIGVYFCAAIAEFAMDKSNKGWPFVCATFFNLCAGYGYLMLSSGN